MTAELRLRDDALAWREVEGEVVALDLRTLNYLGVNQTGAVLWPALAEGTTRDELVQRLVAAFGIDEASAARDLDAFLASLAEHGFLAD